MQWTAVAWSACDGLPRYLLSKTAQQNAVYSLECASPILVHLLAPSWTTLLKEKVFGGCMPFL